MITQLTLMITAQSKVESVVVFADRAEVTRAATATCKGTAIAVPFDPLPMELDVRTLRGEVDGRPAIGVSSDVVEDATPVDERSKALNAEVELLRNAIAIERSALSAKASEVERIEQMGSYAGSLLDEAIRGPKAAHAEWGKGLDRLRDRRIVLAAERVDVEAKIRDLERKLRKAEGLLERIGGPAAQHRRADVAVECKTGGPVTVRLAYVVPGAEWRPEYDVDFTPKSGKAGAGRARLTIGAVIRQSTGEDWIDAKVELSTAKPRLGSEAPYPAPMWISAYERDEGKVLVQGYERREQLESGALAPAEPTGVELDDGGQAVVLSLPHRATVMADGRPYWIPVDTIGSDATGSLVAIPKVRPHVFRVVAMKNPAPYPLLEGRVHAFRSGSYAGDTRVRFRGSGEPMEISLGIDEELVVTRKTLTHQDRGAAFLSSRKHMARAYRIAVTNRSKAKERVEVRENVPVSKIEDLEVELIREGTTAGHRFEGERGLVTFTVDLERGATREVDLAYEIHLPDDWRASNF